MRENAEGPNVSNSHDTELLRETAGEVSKRSDVIAAIEINRAVMFSSSSFVLFSCFFLTILLNCV